MESLEGVIAKAIARSMFNMQGGSDDLDAPEPNAGDQQLAFDIKNAVFEYIEGTGGSLDKNLAEVLAEGIRLHDGNHDKGAGQLGEDLAEVVIDFISRIEVIAAVTKRLKDSDFNDCMPRQRTIIALDKIIDILRGQG